MLAETKARVPHGAELAGVDHAEDADKKSQSPTEP